MNISEGYDSRDTLLRLIRRWPWLMAAICLGGLLGLGLGQLLPPVYEAVAVVGIGVDYGRTLPLDDDALRLAYERVRVLLLSDETLEAASQGGAGGTASASANDLRDTLRLSQIEGGWELGVRSGDADEAARLANAWASVSLEALQTAGQHAWRAAELQTSWFSAGCTLLASATPSLPAAWSCAAAPEGYEPEEALADLEQEAALSHGILPSMSFSALQEAVPPKRELTSSRTLSILAGLLVGAVLGLVGASAAPDRAARR